MIIKKIYMALTEKGIERIKSLCEHLHIEDVLSLAHTIEVVYFSKYTFATFEEYHNGGYELAKRLYDEFGHNPYLGECYIVCTDEMEKITTDTSEEISDIFIQYLKLRNVNIPFSIEEYKLADHFSNASQGRKQLVKARDR